MGSANVPGLGPRAKCTPVSSTRVLLDPPGIPSLGDIERNTHMARERADEGDDGASDTSCSQMS